MKYIRVSKVTGINWGQLNQSLKEILLTEKKLKLLDWTDPHKSGARDPWAPGFTDDEVLFVPTHAVFTMHEKAGQGPPERRVYFVKAEPV